MRPFDWLIAYLSITLHSRIQAAVCSNSSVSRSSPTEPRQHPKAVLPRRHSVSFPEFLPKRQACVWRFVVPMPEWDGRTDVERHRVLRACRSAQLERDVRVKRSHCTQTASRALALVSSYDEVLHAHTYSIAATLVGSTYSSVGVEQLISKIPISPTSSC